MARARKSRPTRRSTMAANAGQDERKEPPVTTSSTVAAPVLYESSNPEPAPTAGASGIHIPDPIADAPHAEPAENGNGNLPDEHKETSPPRSKSYNVLAVAVGDSFEAAPDATTAHGDQTPDSIGNVSPWADAAPNGNFQPSCGQHTVPEVSAARNNRAVARTLHPGPAAVCHQAAASPPHAGPAPVHKVVREQQKWEEHRWDQEQDCQKMQQAHEQQRRHWQWQLQQPLWPQQWCHVEQQRLHMEQHWQQAWQQWQARWQEFWHAGVRDFVAERMSLSPWGQASRRVRDAFVDTAMALMLEQQWSPVDVGIALGSDSDPALPPLSNKERMSRRVRIHAPFAEALQQRLLSANGSHDVDGPVA